MRLVLVPQFLVFLQQSPVFVIYPLRDVSDKLQVMLQLILPVLKFRTGFSLVCFPLFHTFFQFRHLTVELADDILLLLILQLLHPVIYRVDLMLDLFMQLLIDSLVFLISVLLVSESDTMFPLQLIDLLAVLLLALVVPLLTPSQVLLDLLVFIDLGVEQDGYLP